MTTNHASLNRDADRKIMERIRKLLAMANDAGSPHEATIAAGRARKLMDEHQISELDLTTTRAGDFGSSASLSTSDDKAAGVISVAIANLNDCVARATRDPILGLMFTFQGLLADSVCAAELFEYVLRAMERGANDVKGRSAKHSFRWGFARGVAQQVRDIMKERETLHTSDGRALIPVKMALVVEHFGRPNYRRTGASVNDAAAFHSGFAAGRNIGLSRQVTNPTRRLK